MTEESDLLLATGTTCGDNWKSSDSDLAGLPELTATPFSKRLSSFPNRGSTSPQVVVSSKEPDSDCSRRILRAKVHLCIPNQIHHKKLSQGPVR